MKNIKFLIFSSLLLSLFLSHYSLPAQDIKDNSLYFMSSTSGLPSPYRKPWIDTLSIIYNNQDTIVFTVSGQSFFKTGNKTYIYNLFNQEDTVLLYDYDLIQGDTFVIRNSTCIIDSVKSIQYEDGNFYKEWYLSGSRQITWMEKMGTNGGWLWHLDHVGDAPSLEAICHNSEVIYWNFGMVGDGSYPDPTCNFDSLQHILPVSEIKYQNKLLIYPNPATNEIYISEIESVPFEIINNLGKIVLKGNVDENKIDVFSLTAGVYFIRIVKPEGVYTAKFVKE